MGMRPPRLDRSSGNGLTIGPRPASRWKSQNPRSTVSACARTAAEYGSRDPAPGPREGFPATVIHRQKSRASARVALSHQTPAAHRNRNHRSRSSP
jgi:hypothetical protein